MVSAHDAAYVKSLLASAQLHSRIGQFSKINQEPKEHRMMYEFKQKTLVDNSERAHRLLLEKYKTTKVEPDVDYLKLSKKI